MPLRGREAPDPDAERTTQHEQGCRDDHQQFVLDHVRGEQVVAERVERRDERHCKREPAQAEPQHLARRKAPPGSRATAQAPQPHQISATGQPISASTHGSKFQADARVSAHRCGHGPWRATAAEAPPRRSGPGMARRQHPGTEPHRHDHECGECGDGGGHVRNEAADAAHAGCTAVVRCQRAAKVAPFRVRQQRKDDGEDQRHHRRRVQCSAPIGWRTTAAPG